jgi:hypothetical protein
MNLSFSELAQQRIDLLKKYNSLIPPAKQILQIMAVLYEPISKSIAISICNAVAQRDEDFKAYADSTFSPLWKKLIDQQFIIQEQGQGYQCSPVITEVIMREVIAESYFITIVEGITKIRPLMQMYGRTSFRSINQLICHIRWAIYSHDLAKAESYLQSFQAGGSYNRQLAPNFDIFLNLICNNPFDGNWLDTCPHDVADRILVAGARQVGGCRLFN